jgi:putative hemolysin
VTDPPWHPAAARLAQMAGAAIVPVFFHGTNSRLFQAAGLLHPRLRTLLLPREVLKRRASVLRVSIGGPIPAAQVRRFDASEDLMAYARARTFVLSGRTRVCPSRRQGVPVASPLVAAPPSADLRREIEGLPPERRLLENAPYSVWLTTRAATPRLVEEIGRLRELTFRQVGEGTGRATDLDPFDDYYQHLLAWNDGTGEVVGAYRLGQTDAVGPRYRASGLYTHTLFRLGEGFLDEVGPALELGRSFVRHEYQREFAPLMLLWKGIGQMVVAEPRYARLFGAVSISHDYATLSQQLMMAFLRSTRAEDRLARLVAPRNPPAARRGRPDLRSLAHVVGRNMDRVDELVREVEGGERGMPVLLRQYLKLNARVIAFNVDEAFGDVLDALMLVDLRTVDEHILVKYMGRAGAERFQSFHRDGARRLDGRTSPPVSDPAPAAA